MSFFTAMPKVKGVTFYFYYIENFNFYLKYLILNYKKVYVHWSCKVLVHSPETYNIYKYIPIYIKVIS